MRRRLRHAQGTPTGYAKHEQNPNSVDSIASITTIRGVLPTDDDPPNTPSGVSKAFALLSLSGQRQAFVREYVEAGCRNAKGAALRAGFSKSFAHSKAGKLLQDPVIKSAIVEIQTGKSMVVPVVEHAPIVEQRVVGIDLVSTLIGVARVAFADPRKLFNEDGSPKPIHELDDDTAMAIDSIEVVEQYQGSGEERQFTGYVKKYRFSKRGEAQDKLMKHLNGYAQHEAGKGSGVANALMQWLDQKRTALPVAHQVEAEDALG